MSGAFIENDVMPELRKGFFAHGEEPLLHYCRDRDARETDVALESDGELHPVEIKRNANPAPGLTGSFSALDRGSTPCRAGVVVCMASRPGALVGGAFVIPAWMA